MSLVWCLHVVGAYSGDGPTDTMSARFDSFPFARAVRVRLGHARAHVSRFTLLTRKLKIA